MEDTDLKKMFQALTDAMTKISAVNVKQEAQIAMLSAGKNKFKVPEPEPFDLDGGVSLDEFFLSFEDYFADLYGDNKKDAWSPVLKKFLEGEVKDAYMGLKGGNLKWEFLKTTLKTQFADTIQRTNNYKRVFSALAKKENESILAFSIRITKVSKQAHPTYRFEELEDLTKGKFLETLPADISEKMSIALVNTDLTTAKYSCLVSMAERFEALAPKTNIVEVTNTTKTIVLGAAEPALSVQAVTSLRPNGVAMPKLVCSHCNKPNHSQDRCWTLNPQLKPNNNRGNNYNSNSRGNPRGGYNNNRGASNNNPNNNRKCYTCNDYGHLANACPSRQQNVNIPPPNFQKRAQNAAVFNTNRQCNICGVSGVNFHAWQQCPKVQQEIANQSNTAVVTNNTDLNMQPFNALNL
ncbi:unnamed protein product [Rotaria magnacalcarata]|uniref:CCHC-type domain-containing protein n=1 Tax=Rotaria magnacalcarata TaxID=392030 RepID=A0A820HBX5_9BILA|nr:unnamed protein product [Rotaria magnacalcarata]